MPIYNQIMASLAAYFFIISMVGSKNSIEENEFFTCCFFYVLATLIPYIDNIIYFIRKKLSDKKIRRKKYPRKHAKVPTPNRFLHNLETLAITGILFAILMSYGENFMKEIFHFNPRPMYWDIVLGYFISYGIHLLLDIIASPGIPIAWINGADLYRIDPPLRKKHMSMYIFTTLMIILTLILFQRDIKYLTFI